jgi:hypothetical protein
MDLERALILLLDSGVEFVVIGGVAMFAHGSSRLTRDLDICYSRSRDNLERLSRTLAPYRPKLRGAPADVRFRFDTETIARGLNFTLETDLGDLDLLGEVAGLGGYREAAAASATMTLFGRSCAVLSLEGLIRAKRAAGRPRDLEAAVELEALRELEEGK